MLIRDNKFSLQAFILLPSLLGTLLQSLMQQLIIIFKLLNVVLIAYLIFFDIALQHFNVFFSLLLFVTDPDFVLLNRLLMLLTGIILLLGKSLL